MAEWLSTDLFERAQSPPGYWCKSARSRFRPRPTTFADSSDCISNRADKKQNSKADSEKKLRRQQLAYEIHLQDENDSNRTPSRALQFLFVPKLLSGHVPS